MTRTSHSVSSAAVTYDQPMSGVYTGIITVANRPRAMFAKKLNTPRQRSAMSDLTRDQIRHLSQLAHLNLTDEELDRVSDELDQIVDSVARVQEVASEDIEATSHPIALTNVFRADVVRGVLTQDETLAGAPEAETGRFKVPAILAEDDR